MNEILDFYERRAVPDKERITGADSDLVQQWGSNADAVAERLGMALQEHVQLPMHL